MSLTKSAQLPLVLALVQVVQTQRLSPAFVRVELGGPALADVGVDGPLLDQRIKLLLPGPHGLPDLDSADLQRPGWYAAWQALPEEVRGHLRTYTIRSLRGTGADTRLVVDLVLHLEPGATGPGARWGAHAQVGDRVGLVAPRRGVPFGGIEFTPGSAGRLLLVADETAVPAVGGILDGLPDDAAGTAYLEVPSAADRLDLSPPPGVRVVWLPRGDAPHGERLCRAVFALFGLEANATATATATDAGDDQIDPALWETPSYSSSGEPVLPGSEPVGGLYAWVAGEAGTVTALRRHLVRDAGLDRSQVAFMGYWRQGVAMRG